MKSTKRNVKKTGGRPSKSEARRLPEKILQAATDLFFAEGYGSTSIEAIAKRACISKRTFYHRFPDKPAVFAAVIRRIIDNLRPPASQQIFEGKNLEEILLRLAHLIIRASLTHEALSLQRIVLAEATRFPELALIFTEQGARKEAVAAISKLLEKETHAKNTVFAAEQFLQMITSVPQRRALGLGQPLTPKELDAWERDTVTLFLRGFLGSR